MFARALVTGLVGGLLFVAGCGKSEDSTPEGSSGQATSGSPGSAGATAGAGTHAGGSASGASGAMASGGIASGTAGQASAGSSSQAGAGNEAGASNEGLVDCDQRKIACKRLAPTCGAMEVPSVEGTCYGECVKIDRCACASADECPNSNEYTCWGSKHCGPYVN
jgi:hypothetical protein